MNCEEKKEKVRKQLIPHRHSSSLSYFSSFICSKDINSKTTRTSASTERSSKFFENNCFFNGRLS